MSLPNSVVADLLDKVANYIENSEGIALRQKHAAHQAKVAEVAKAIEEAAGQELNAAAREKLATADAVLLDLLLKQAHTMTEGTPYSLGGPADNPTNTKTASRRTPDEIFADFLLNS